MFNGLYYTRHIVIVDRLEDEAKNPPGPTRWQETLAWTPPLLRDPRDLDFNRAERPDSSSYGRGLEVSWRLRDENEDDEAEPIVWLKVAFEMMGQSALISNSYGVNVLYEHFIPDGVFDFEREKARERGADDGVDLPMQTI
ncbi:hypothetical protein BDP81DRAFT_186027 [Colletotrichum phormii]|uniref:Uncharacterized protein n=1 Tax=Colletotrichum phormii TaxID=359342 RepID=A0AAJ0EIF7_9PEZI|nr:uncharacterized protein BDP81DRAFT_186027 [Colletotrichum phormii]KAK1639954.1 hypothetical protein BDP81DRAFT_186027 [Colletotrichum phormii]